MKHCPICNKYPVKMGTGFCKEHHKIYIEKVRQFKKNFIGFMNLKIAQEKMWEKEKPCKKE